MIISIKTIRKTVIVITIVAIGILVYFFREDIKDIIYILSDGSLEDVVLMIHTWGLFAPIISVLLMILQAFIAPIPSFLITGANGVIFGLFWGVIISWIGAMFGAAGTFYLARFLGIKFVNKFEKSSQLLKKVDEISQKHGVKVVFIGRLLPFVSFDFLSYAAGLSNMKAWPFFYATGIGMLPGTIAFVLLGNQILALSAYSNSITIIIFVGILVFLIHRMIKLSIVARSKRDKH